MMTDATLTVFSISEPFSKALSKIRESLTAANLCIAGELDVSARIRRELGLTFEPCRILLIDTPILLLESVALDRAGATLLPLHLVVFANGQSTHVEWRNAGPGALAPRLKLQNALCRALERIASRQDFEVVSHEIC